jgi:transposase
MASKPVRPWLPGQPTLLPTDLRSWLPETHLVWFILEVVERLDLSAIRGPLDQKDPRGALPYDPRMMVALLIYAYAVGVFSSRRIERATYEDVAFRVLTADQQPDHETIAKFRREHLAAFSSLFVQVLQIAGQMGLIGFGVLGLDGVKVLANASKHQAMSYDRMKKERALLEEEIGKLLAMAEQADADEARFGDGRQMDVPEELKRRQDRKAKIDAAMAELEAEARDARLDELREQLARHQERAADPTLDESNQKRAATLAAQREAAIAELERESDDDDQGDGEPPAGGAGDEPGVLPHHRPLHERDGKPKDKAQRNFTDGDSRIMVRDGDHIVQAFNAQAVVDNTHQIIVAEGVGNQAPDAQYLEPMLDRVNANVEAAGLRKPAEAPLAADTGYFSESNVAGATRRGFDPYIAPERSKHRRYELPGGQEPDGTDRSEDDDEADTTPQTLAVASGAADADHAEAAGEPPSVPATKPGTDPPPPTPRDTMRAKLKTEKGAEIYGKRKTTPEPVFGQILHCRGFRRFSLRGLDKVRGEWTLVTLTHNLLKAWRSGVALPAPA